MRVRRAIHRNFGQDATPASSAASAVSADAATLSPADVATGVSTLDPSLSVSSRGVPLIALWAVSVFSGLTVYTLTRWLDSKRSPRSG